jgi:hypothetical protein
MVIVAAAVLAATLEIDFTSLMKRARTAEVRGLTCGIKTVGYRFVGAPGTKFRYEGDEYVVPTAGAVELISSRRKTAEYEANGTTLPLDVWPIDQFGFRTVPLPKPTEPTN